MRKTMISSFAAFAALLALPALAQDKTLTVYTYDSFVAEWGPGPKVKEAFVAFSRRYAPWAFEDPALEGVRDKAKDLFLAGAEAYAQLGDFDRRNEALSKRRAAREEASKRAQGDAFAIKTDLLDPAQQYRKGLQVKASGDSQGARRHFEFAADCDPQNGAYRAEAAHCLYLCAPLSIKQALGEIEEALRADPKCGLACYYAGEILRASGDKAGAEAWFRRAGPLMPKDPRPLEALRTLGAFRK